ncbi:MAG TPA: hypothetical protein QF838_10725, partial [SAR202 cluster bacterium]|nr:hypothetical protein [SAR202 cluster bacterium]
MRKILKQEVASEFNNSTVIGGIEAFLSSNVGMLPERFLEPLKGYSIMNNQQRAYVVGELIRALTPDVKPNFSTPRKDIFLADSIESFKKSGRGWPVKKISESLGLNTVKDLILHFPERHEDFSNIRKISDLISGETQSSELSVKSLQLKKSRNGKHDRVEIEFSDTTGSMKVTFFGQQWILKDLKPGDKVMLSGKVEYEKGKPTYKNPVYDRINPRVTKLHTGRLVPVYKLTQGIIVKTLRREIHAALTSALDQLDEYLPETLLSRTGLYPIKKAVARYHYPRNIQDFSRARRRIAFDELFLVQLAMRKKKLDWKNQVSGISLNQNRDILSLFISTLPFKLTLAQSRCMDEICEDLSSGIP